MFGGGHKLKTLLWVQERARHNIPAIIFISAFSLDSIIASPLL
jgi:hypothetical protein